MHWMILAGPLGSDIETFHFKACDAWSERLYTVALLRSSRQCVSKYLGRRAGLDTGLTTGGGARTDGAAGGEHHVGEMVEGL